MTAIVVLAVFALVFIWSAIHRYRSDSMMLTAGLASAVGGIGGISLCIPQILLNTSRVLLLVMGSVAVVLAVGGSIYAERRYRLLELEETRRRVRGPKRNR